MRSVAWSWALAVGRIHWSTNTKCELAFSDASSSEHRALAALWEESGREVKCKIGDVDLTLGFSAPLFPPFTSPHPFLFITPFIFTFCSSFKASPLHSFPARLFTPLLSAPLSLHSSVFQLPTDSIVALLLRRADSLSVLAVGFKHTKSTAERNRYFAVAISPFPGEYSLK